MTLSCIIEQSNYPDPSVSLESSSVTLTCHLQKLDLCVSLTIFTFLFFSFKNTHLNIILAHEYFWDNLNVQQCPKGQIIIVSIRIFPGKNVEPAVFSNWVISSPKSPKWITHLFSGSILFVCDIYICLNMFKWFKCNNYLSMLIDLVSYVQSSRYLFLTVFFLLFLFRLCWTVYI